MMSERAGSEHDIKGESVEGRRPCPMAEGFNPQSFFIAEVKFLGALEQVAPQAQGLHVVDGIGTTE